MSNLCLGSKRGLSLRQRVRQCWAGGSETVKRAPPAGEEPTSTVPSCERATASTIASPSPVPESAARSAGPASRGEAREDVLALLGGDAGPVVGHLEHGVAVAAGDGELDRRALGGVAQPVVEQVQRHPVQLVGVAVDRHAVGSVQLQPVPVGDRARPRPSPPPRSLRGRLAPGAGAARVGAGQQQQVGDETAHALRGAQRRGDDLALLARRARTARAARGAARGWRGCWSAGCAAHARRRR